MAERQKAMDEADEMRRNMGMGLGMGPWGTNNDYGNMTIGHGKNVGWNWGANINVGKGNNIGMGPWVPQPPKKKKKGWLRKK